MKAVVTGLLAIGLMSCGGASVDNVSNESALTSNFSDVVATSEVQENGDIYTVLEDADSQEVLAELRYDAHTGEFDVSLADIDEEVRLDRDIDELVMPDLQTMNELLHDTWQKSADSRYLSTWCVRGLCACASGCYRYLRRYSFGYYCCCMCP